MDKNPSWKTTLLQPCHLIHLYTYSGCISVWIDYLNALMTVKCNAISRLKTCQHLFLLKKALPCWLSFTKDKINAMKVLAFQCDTVTACQWWKAILSVYRISLFFHPCGCFSLWSGIFSIGSWWGFFFFWFSISQWLLTDLLWWWTGLQVLLPSQTPKPSANTFREWSMWVLHQP